MTMMSLGIYASMHTASVLSRSSTYVIEELPSKLICFWSLRQRVLRNVFRTLQSIHSFDSDDLESLLQVQFNLNGVYSFKHSVPDRTVTPFYY